MPVDKRCRSIALAVCLLACVAPVTGVVGTAQARGVSPYLPLNLSPEIERQIERVLVLADKPVMTRPIAAATVLEALPKARKFDPALCDQVERYLRRYMRNSGITQLRAEVAASGGSSKQTIPDAHGMQVDSPWQVSAAAFYQPNDYLILNAGGVAYDGRATPTGTLLSMGFDFAQLDVGYRDHWFSPLTDSSLLMSTQAPTMPSITLSNYRPLTSLGLQYQVFLAQMSKSDRITYQGGYTTGNPRLAGLHLQIEPASGYALSVNRLFQFGGGARGGTGFHDFLKALYNSNRYDNIGTSLNTDQEFGNQQASITSRVLFPAKTPFAVYFEYAGEDSSYRGSYRLGNVAFSMGIDFPRLWNAFDLTYEVSEWQNAWYVHHIYQDGMTNHGHVIGHWFGDERQFNDDVGGVSNMLRLGWQPNFGGYAQVRYRTLQNAGYSPIQYRRMHELGISYSHPWRSNIVGAELLAGRDVFGENYARLAASLNFNQDWWAADTSSSASSDSGELVDLFVDAGVNASTVASYLGDVSEYIDGHRNPDAWHKTSTKYGPHLGVGARRVVSQRGDLGARLELDRVNGHDLLSVRVLDYRYRIGRHFALSAFFGAGRYNLGTPAYGYYMGGGVQWRDILPRWDLSLDGRHHEKVARDKLLASDPNPPSEPHNDEFFDIDGSTLYVSYRF